MSLLDTKKSICVINKGKTFYSGSTFKNINGQWGISYAVGDKEKSDLLALVNSVARGTNDVELSQKLVEESYSAFRFLYELGVEFDTKTIGQTRIRPCFSKKESYASLISFVSQFRENIRKVIKQSNITLLSNSEVVQITSDTEKCTGCIVRRDNEIIKITTNNAVVLATGGDCGNFYPNIVDKDLTGDGYKLADDLGLKLVNLKYKQRVWEDCNGRRGFHPYMFFSDKYKFTDYSYAPVNDIYGDFKRHKDERVSHVPISNLQPDKIMDKHYLSYIPELNSRFALNVINKKSGQVEYKVLPYYQVSNGGIEVNENGETSLRDLYAVGEVAGGMHGGDRVGGMMICAAIVFGRRAARSILNRS